MRSGVCEVLRLVADRVEVGGISHSAEGAAVRRVGAVPDQSEVVIRTDGDQMSRRDALKSQLYPGALLVRKGGRLVHDHPDRISSRAASVRIEHSSHER